MYSTDLPLFRVGWPFFEDGISRAGTRSSTPFGTSRESERSVPSMPGKVNWKLFAVVLTSGLAASSVVFIGVSQGAIAASFLISGQPSKVYAKRAEGTGLIQYGAFDRRYDGKIVPVMVSGLRESTIKGLCQSTILKDVPLVGTITVKVTADEVTARNAYTDVTESISGVSIVRYSESGIAAGAARKGPGVKAGDKTDLASPATDADSVSVTDSKQIVLASSAEITTSTGSVLRFHKGANECF
ncbi:DUF6230 family protein [Streptomyces collinus]|uniref:DUF6230 family protein n=1 Tax=Streptomyces collinus TaxID=42684 RepID=UPI0036B8E427